MCVLSSTIAVLELGYRAAESHFHLQRSKFKFNFAVSSAILAPLFFVLGSI
jgi:hypothetical protein